jgi:Protein of unknown function (Hypoth_ymh)
VGPDIHPYRDGPASLHRERPEPAGQNAPNIDQLHPTVVAAAGSLFASGHFSQAVFEALKALEGRVQKQSGLSHLLGRDLMTHAFRSTDPPSL